MAPRNQLIPPSLPRQYARDHRLLVTSDQHYGHKNILRYQAETRSHGTVEEMDEALIANHNTVVREGDHVIHLGDICFGTKERLALLLRRLHGTHYLMDGSHDRALGEYRIWEEKPTDLTEKVHLLPKLFEFTYQGKKIVLCHYAMATWWASHHGSYHLFGHSHGHFSHPGRAIDVGVDSPEIPTRLHPLTIEDAITAIDKKRPFTPRA